MNQPEPLTFTRRFSVVEAISWELYKRNLKEELFDRTATAQKCPEQIKESAWTGEVTIRPYEFVVTVTEGEHD